MTKFSAPLLLIVFPIILILIWWPTSLQPVQTRPSPTNFVVYPNESASSVIDRLAQARLIRSALATKVHLKRSQLEGKIKPGAYTLSPHVSSPKIIDSLVSGPIDVWVTIPEGWRREQIAARLAKYLPLFDTSQFLAQTRNLEGQLFPDTYLIPLYSSPSQIVQIFLTNFSRKTGLNLSRSQTIVLGPKQVRLTDAQILTLASLVEREAKSDPDRAKIAGILLNRYLEGWALQVDATVQYARDTQVCKLKTENCKFWEKISDTRFPSQFNTYLHPSLPPGPIANPGLSAIAAVKSPLDSAFRYYLTDPQGQTHYAASLSEHQLNIDKYLIP